MATIQPPQTLAIDLQRPGPAANGATSAFQRLVTLLRLAEGAWALAVFEDGAVQRQVTTELRAALAPLP